MRVCVVVYNVRGFGDGSERLVRLVDRFRPDVLLLNETGARWRLRRFARALGMELAADPWSPFRRRVKDAVLVRPPWWVVEHRQHRFEGGSWLYPRGALVAMLEEGDARLCAISVHLGLHPRERLAHARALAALLEGVGAPIVAGGDLNEKPDGRAVGFLSERLRDAWLLGGDAEGETFPADEPTARIDYLFVSGGIVAERVLVPLGPDAREASDHRPLVAELTLPGPE
jgi:endonuclease/exonuclease/phosphatase family metal-dependent hydrolase